MAQDFYRHFGKDSYGTIGNDTTIATADFDGVSFAAIKALEERTRELKSDLASEKRFWSTLELTTRNLEQRTQKHEQTIEELQAQLQIQLQKNTEYESEFQSVQAKSKAINTELLSVRAESRTVQAESKALKNEFKELKEMIFKTVVVTGTMENKR